MSAAATIVRAYPTGDEWVPPGERGEDGGEGEGDKAVQDEIAAELKFQTGLAGLPTVHHVLSRQNTER